MIHFHANLRFEAPPVQVDIILSNKWHQTPPASETEDEGLSQKDEE